jgi:hypothetical protein
MAVEDTQICYVHTTATQNTISQENKKEMISHDKYSNISTF